MCGPESKKLASLKPDLGVVSRGFGGALLVEHHESGKEEEFQDRAVQAQGGDGSQVRGEDVENPRGRNS